MPTPPAIVSAATVFEKGNLRKALKRSLERVQAREAYKGPQGRPRLSQGTKVQQPRPTVATKAKRQKLLPPPQNAPSSTPHPLCFSSDVRQKAPSLGLLDLLPDCVLMQLAGLLSTLDMVRFGTCSPSLHSIKAVSVKWHRRTALCRGHRSCGRQAVATDVARTYAE